jgi:phenylalanyl-tRNA synthetase alpha chain
LLEKLESLRQTALEKLAAIDTTEDLKAWNSQYIGKKGEITVLLRSTGQLPAEERPIFGKTANEVKSVLENAHDQREALIREQLLARDLEEGAIDVTLPGRPRQVGGLHPSTQVLRRFYSIWADMGFQVFRSREVETDEYNFQLLNFPPDHPARDMQDTFYTKKSNVILRTHTSPGQIRAMQALGENGTQPIRVILPGMCFRYEQVTARSEIQFNQVEGLAIGRNIRMSDLKGTITEFARRMYGDDVQIRFRASYFPFTEPSMEVDISSPDARLTKGTGWVEIAGSGMVHPEVLKNGGYDPAEWSGFAFGMGPERVIMRKHSISDIRYFWGNDLRFLEQF